ncbi:hypothetical protein SARC_10119 [Sphaeroforma arctica JP610]|uniref:Uncharacterized protein n=1 Tax=Sphaeroforma arctica JP610 TaxID=667725 RepID=A0A0L0FKV1_9EUKA|nr:hypothetical protein SARC_10119 [Sphaeroforma arctica JP610]KNC77414.1 hypothetical protein SARC_10119 [Sphaeroforma arctica JP610]|eukprot:XP_014151316.1 hypothetical protein SARC_10119 [Sphaeroforma arctica JP610]
MVASLHTVMDHMYFLGNAKKWLGEAMDADKLSVLLQELDCAFEWEDSAHVSECTRKMADALRDFHARIEGSDTVSEVKSEIEAHNNLHGSGEEGSDSDSILVVLVGGFMIVSVFAAATYGGVYMYGKRRKGGQLFNNDRIDESMMMVADEDDLDGSDDELAL